MTTPWEVADRAQQQLNQAVTERKIVAQMLTQAQQILTSAALWCDLGAHSFSPRDRKRATYQIHTIDEDTGQPVEDTLTACGPHAAERQVTLTPKLALNGPPKGADPKLYEEFLEWQAGRAAEPERPAP